MAQSMEKDFVLRTLHILENYDGPYGVTLLVNCLLGLIVLPKERGYNHIAEPDGIRFEDLGLQESDILCWGKVPERERTAARFIRCIRNSVAHIQIESISDEREITALRFSDESGFEAVLPIEKIKKMVAKLAEFIR